MYYNTLKMQRELCTDSKQFSGPFQFTIQLSFPVAGYFWKGTLCFYKWTWASQIDHGYIPTSYDRSVTDKDIRLPCASSRSQCQQLASVQPPIPPPPFLLHSHPMLPPHHNCDGSHRGQSYGMDSDLVPIHHYLDITIHCNNISQYHLQRFGFSISILPRPTEGIHCFH